jgi:hypothetical protein
MDLQDRATNPFGEKEQMTTLASLSSFLGTFWFILLVAVGSFGAGMVFKAPFLRLISGGKWSGD